MKEEVIIIFYSMKEQHFWAGEKVFFVGELKQMLNWKKFVLWRKCHTTSNLLLSGRQKKEWLDDYNEDVIARLQNSKSLNRAIAEGHVKITVTDC